MNWFSIEILDGSTSASTWAEIFRDSLVADAVSMTALDWAWHRHAWGVVFEVAFADEEAWERYRSSLTVVRALDAAPDPVSGVIMYRGRGGSSGRGAPRTPRPLAGSGAACLPLPVDRLFEEVSPPRALTR